MNKQAQPTLRDLTQDVQRTEAKLREGGGPSGQERQRRLGRLPVRERIARLLDNGTHFFELNLWAAWNMYPDVGGVPGAGIVTGIGAVSGRDCMIIANDGTVKAGAFFPQTVKKLLRAQRIAFECNLPIIYLVDSAGAYLPMQDEIFPDEDDFGRIFRNNSVLSAAGVPQYAAIMGNCIAGGAYLPVLSDVVLMTEGSGLYIAGPALVKAAIGQEADPETLGGATMHSEISGTVDFKAKTDEECLDKLRELISLLPQGSHAVDSAVPAQGNAENLYELVDAQGRKEYDMHRVIDAVVDRDSWQPFKPDYGQTLICGFSRIGGQPAGIVANQRMRVQSKTEGVQIGGVIYPDAADKAARFIMDCNQTRVPILFLQDVMGFMVGKEVEHEGIIRRGAKLVNAVSNCIVPKITVVVGGSFGAGNYAMCGKAYDPTFIFAWPNAKYAVMGAAQASGVIFDITKKALERDGKDFDEAELNQLRQQVHANYEQKTDIRYGAARGWVDAIIPPDQTRAVVMRALQLAGRERPTGRFHTGVLQT